jgi:hypothetical protein
MKFLPSIIVAGFISFSCLAAQAAGIDYRAMEEQGFGDVAALMRSMSPQQQQEILAQAELKIQYLEKLSPQELQQLIEQLQKITSTIAMDKIDAGKLDVSKSKDAGNIRQDLNIYQKKHDEGKIDNPVVIHKVKK